jgi:hypothetical protein
LYLGSKPFYFPRQESAFTASPPRLASQGNFQRPPGPLIGDLKCPAKALAVIREPLLEHHGQPPATSATKLTPDASAVLLTTLFSANTESCWKMLMTYLFAIYSSMISGLFGRNYAAGREFIKEKDRLSVRFLSRTANID